MQLLVLIGWDGGIPILKTKRRFLIGQPIIWVANCEWSGLRQQMTKNQWQASKNAGRAECSTLMKTGATILKKTKQIIEIKHRVTRWAIIKVAKKGLKQLIGYLGTMTKQL